MARRGWEVTYVPRATFIHHYKRGSHRGLVNMEKIHHLASGLRFWAKWNMRAARLAAVLRWLAPLIVLAVDLVLINLGFMACLQLRDAIAGELPHAATDHSALLPILAGTNGMLVLAFGSAGLYRVERSKDWLAVSARAIKAITWVALAGMVFLFFAPGYRHGLISSRLTFLLYYLLLLVTVPMSRLFIRLFFRACWRRHLLLKRVVVVGEARHADRLAESIRAEPICGYQVAAVLATTAPPDDEDDEDRGSEAPSFDKMMKDQRPAGVIFVARNRSVRGLVPDLLYCFKRNMEVRVATNRDFMPLIHSRAGEICGEPAADVTRPPFYPIKRSLKRISDLVLTFVAVVAAAPLLLLLAILIRLQDGGPALFVQRRVGKNGRTFGMLKLRTMRVNTEEIDLNPMANIAEGPLTMIPNDPRVTPLGRWLRRHKLDELPQLLNVLAGQMSLVGPRPPTPDEVQQYTSWQRCRLAVRPGITGLWQIDKERKWRFDEMVELDLRYILNWSLLLDYGVMLRTVPVVLRGT
jgi:exopolysaccharide biosynthesis polyprenyl glycosylphosphotransferase